MAKRALLIGAETGKLEGVHADVKMLGETLEAFGFDDLRPVIGSAATYAGILAAYRKLIDETGPDDAVVVYYSGHGSRLPNEGRPPRSAEPAWLQYIQAFDGDDLSEGVFRGVLAHELSVLLVELTARAINVTSIIDCCHAARMSRDPELVPKGDEGLSIPWEWVRERWAPCGTTRTSAAATATPTPSSSWPRSPRSWPGRSSDRSAVGRPRAPSPGRSSRCCAGHGRPS